MDYLYHETPRIGFGDGTRNRIMQAPPSDLDDGDHEESFIEDGDDDSMILK